MTTGSEQAIVVKPSEKNVYARLETGRIMWLGMAGDGRASTQVSAR